MNAMAASTQISLIILASLLISFQFLLGSCSTKVFTITNNCSYTVWPGILPGQGVSPLSSTGFALKPGESNILSVPPGWYGDIWGRTLCSYDITGKFSCLSGDCGSSTVECSGGKPALPVTQAQFTLNDTTDGLDSMVVSLENGFNLPMWVDPGVGTTDRATNCRASGCVACQAQPCNSSSSSQFFKKTCTGARVNVYDPPFNCASANYTIIFCSRSLSKLGNGNYEVVGVIIFVVAIFAFLCVCFIAWIFLQSNADEPIPANTPSINYIIPSTTIVVLPETRPESETIPQPLDLTSYLTDIGKSMFQAFVQRC